MVTRVAKFMLLGGPMDHATQLLPVNTLGAPPEEYLHESKREGATLYQRYRVQGGSLSWFTLIAEGHQPTTSALLDTNPYYPQT